MSKVPPHKLFVYQKPRQGTDFLRTYDIANYKHKLTWMGNFETASCNVVVGQAEAERIFRDFIGNVVTIHVDDPMTPIFEGYINAIVYEVGSVVFRRSLDEMANRVRVTYYNADSPAAQKTEITATLSNTASQAIYGIKDANLDAGVHYDNADKTHKTALRGAVLNAMAYPQVSVSSRAGGGVLLSLEIKGLYQMWGWEIYNDTTNVTAIASEIFRDISTATRRPANSDYLYEVTGTTGYNGLISSNSGFNQNSNSKTGQTFLQFLQSNVEAGDGTNEWTFGFTARDFNRTSTTQRRVYYRAANTAVEYTAKALRDTGVIFDLFGRRIDPWRVTPDARIQITDVLLGYDQAGDNPSQSYVKFIDYDAESQQVSWQSSDDNTLEGVMQFRKYFKRHGTRFGAPIRPLV